jgi:putative methyltransferase (TIGR04325 family)
MDPLARLKSVRLLRPVLGYLYDRRFRQNRQGQLFMGVFDTAAAASASAPGNLPMGYDQPAAAAMYREWLDQVTLQDYPTLYWLRRLQGEVHSLFDYGGHVGVKYYAYARYLQWPADFVWTVCDVPAVAKSGTELAAEKKAANLKFVTSITAVDGQDLLMCSGSLQYIEPSLHEELRPLARKPKHVVINGVPYYDGRTFFTLNSIGTAFCPYKIQNLAEFTAGMGQLGYELVDRWTIPGKECIVPLHPEHSVHEYTGMYLRMK